MCPCIQFQRTSRGKVAGCGECGASMGHTQDCGDTHHPVPLTAVHKIFVKQEPSEETTIVPSLLCYIVTHFLNVS